MSDKFSLFAKDEEWYYKGVELFHKHYMPSKTILRYALNKIEDKKPKMIAPQHGSIIKGNMIHKVTERLKKINCGLYLIAGEGNDNLNSLEEVDDILSRFFEITVLTSNLAPVLKELYKLIKRKIATLNQIRLTGNISDEKLLVIDVNDNGASRNIVSKSLNANSAGSICKSIGLTFGRQNLGYLMICGKLTKMQEETIQTLLRALRRPIKAILRREISEIRKTLMMQKEIYTDPLTQLYNRRFLEDKVPAFLEDYYKAELPISVVMIDIDFFKRVNDTYGHDAGDCVLRDIGKLLRENLRSSDFAIRYGGEEFLIVLPNTKGKETCKKLDKLHNYIAGKKFCKDKINITISAGVNECNPSSNLISCIKKADEKLYKAKNNGRNMVIC
ncbi:MAG: diguanylate cyclase [Nitrospiraceae bacterium]|nr:diguanylate cyclase [Nitrospiraceae bacterium]